MDKRVLRERMRRKQQQLRRRRMIKRVTCVIAAVLLLIFVVRGVILPIANHVGGGSNNNAETVNVKANTAGSSSDSGTADGTASAEDSSTDATVMPVKGTSAGDKLTVMTPGWHEDSNGKWYQNPDGTYYINGFADIDGTTYSFDANGYMQTGWVEKGVKDYYFNDDGSYDPSKKRPMIALTFDDGPGEYTSELLDCLEENNAHATFFMLGQNVQNYQDDVKRMLELGCEIGNHSWDHANMYELSLDSVVKEFNDADQALIDACGQASTVVRAPYGNANEDIMNAVGKPFFMWSLDSLDWKYKDVDLDYKSIMQDNSSVIKDGTIILMHDIHEPSVKAAERIIPELINMGFKLVTVSEMAEAKNVTLQNASYNNFWQDILDQGLVPGYAGNSTSDADTSDGTEDSSDGSEDGSGSDGSEDYSDGSEDGSNSSE